MVKYKFRDKFILKSSFFNSFIKFSLENGIGISNFFIFFHLYSHSRVPDLSLFASDTLVGLPVGTIDILEHFQSFHRLTTYF